MQLKVEKAMAQLNFYVKQQGGSEDNEFVAVVEKSLALIEQGY